MNLFAQGYNQEATVIFYVLTSRGCPLRNCEDRNYRILRQVLPGKYTFILPASRKFPDCSGKRRHVGIRIPDSPAALALIRELGPP